MLPRLIFIGSVPVCPETSWIVFCRSLEVVRCGLDFALVEEMTSFNSCENAATNIAKMTNTAAAARTTFRMTACQSVAGMGMGASRFLRNSEDTGSGCPGLVGGGLDERELPPKGLSGMSPEGKMAMGKRRFVVTMGSSDARAKYPRLFFLGEFPKQIGTIGKLMIEFCVSAQSSLPFGHIDFEIICCSQKVFRREQRALALEE